MRYLYIYLLPFPSRWGCSNGGLNVVFVTLPWDVNERIFVSPTVRRLIAVCNVLPLLMSWWSFLRPMDLVMTKWNGSFVPFLDKEVARGNYDHPLAAPYSEVVQFGDGHGNMMSPSPFFFFLAVMVLGVPPLRSYYSMAAWRVSWPRVTLG